MFAKKLYGCSFILVLVMSLVLVPWLAAPVPLRAEKAPEAAGALLQFQSGGHVLGFAPEGMYVSNGTYALRVAFVGAESVAPQAAASGAGDSGAVPALTEVSYPNLWPGISLTYDGGAGIARSTYTLAPEADPGAIRLRYNAPVQVTAGGSLRIGYETGTVEESAPRAWQEIEGQRVPVTVGFALLGGDEVGFRIGYYDHRYPLTIDPTLLWHTFLGGSGSDDSYGTAVDGSGNVYVVGYSGATWGDDPVRAYSGDDDAFVAKLGSDGSLLWHTFLGGDSYDYGRGIAVDGSGHVYVVGKSYAAWGNDPMRAYDASYDAFVAKLDSDGSLSWHTFLGGSGLDSGRGIAVDGSGHAYVVGESSVAWGSPVRAHDASYDAFVAKLGSDGSLSWHTFLGGSGSDQGGGITVDGSGHAYVVGYSQLSWGDDPVRGYGGGGYDAFAAKLGSDGSLLWHTFLGGSDGADVGNGIAVDGSGSIYVVGESRAVWDDTLPVREYGGGLSDAFGAKLGSDGSLSWYTFLGGSDDDRGYGIALDSSGGVYVVGYSCVTWGSPVWAYGGGSRDAFAAKLGCNGSLNWHTFLGGSDSDYGYGIAADGSGGIYVAGSSKADWGTPVQVYTDGNDAFVAKLVPALTQMVSPSLVKPGEALTYTLAFSYNGTLPATDVVITDALSSHITGASYTSSGVALTPVPDSRYVWTAPELTPGAGGVVTISGVLTQPLAAGVFTNTVTLAFSETVETSEVPMTVENVAPVADAGVDLRVAPGAVVMLAGCAADDNGDALSYAWTQSGGPAVVLDGAATATPSFTAGATVSTVYTFTLNVDDGALDDTDVMAVTVGYYACYLPLILNLD